MPSSINLCDILFQVKNLEKKDQFTLLEHLIALVRKQENIRVNTGLVSLSGTGAEIWENTNIDQYIDDERQW